VNGYGLTTIQTAGFPLLVFTFTSPNRTWDQTFLSNYIAINIQDELARVPGIGQVRIFGSSNYAMRVWVTPDTLANMGLTVTDLVNAISAQNVVNPAGQIGGEPAPPGQQLTYTIRARGRLMNAEEFGDIVVRANADGSFVRLRTSPASSSAEENYNMQAYTNGAPAALFALYQVPGSNALEVANRVKSAMARLAERFPSDMRADLTLDTTIPVTEGAKEILITLAEAIGLVLLVVFVFLGSFRATWVPIQTIPVSLVGTFLFFPMLGFTINTLSLLGLVLAVGLVVDDAIVVVEAVQGEDRRGPHAARRRDRRHGRGGRRARRHRARALECLHPGGFHPRHHRIALPAVRAHHRVLRPPLDGERAHLQARAVRADSPAASEGRAARTPWPFLLRRVRSRLHVGAGGVRPGLSRAHPEGRPVAPRPRRLRGLRRRSREDPAAVIHAAGRPGLLPGQRPAPRGRLASADKRRHAEGRRDPEGAARRPLHQLGVGVQHPLADEQSAKRPRLRPARSLRRNARRRRSRRTPSSPP